MIEVLYTVSVISVYDQKLIKAAFLWKCPVNKQISNHHRTDHNRLNMIMVFITQIYMVSFLHIGKTSGHYRTDLPIFRPVTDSMSVFSS